MVSAVLNSICKIPVAISGSANKMILGRSAPCVKSRFFLMPAVSIVSSVFWYADPCRRCRLVLDYYITFKEIVKSVSKKEYILFLQRDKNGRREFLAAALNDQFKYSVLRMI